MTPTSPPAERPDQQDQSDRAGTQDRRTVLRAAGLVVLGGSAAVGLAACASGSAAPTATSAPPSSAAPSSASPTIASPTTASPTTASPTTASPTQSASSSAPAPTGPNVAASDVPVGSGVILDEPDNYVVTQPTRGKYKAFTAICTHQQCRVTEVRDDVIYCPCHDSEFSIKNGSVVNPPAQEPLEEFDVQVSGGKVYVQA